MKNDEQTAVSTSVAETIKETTKTASYSLVVIAGIAIAVSVVYVLYSELFSSQSPQSIYSRAFKDVISDERVLNLFGDRIKGFGEPTSRGRRRHVSHVEYLKDDKKYLRMKFYIKGSRASGSVNLEMVEDDRGRYQYRYLFVISDGLDRRSIILEDNRNKYDNSSIQIPGEGLQELVLTD